MTAPHFAISYGETEQYLARAILDAPLVADYKLGSFLFGERGVGKLLLRFGVAFLTLIIGVV
jgi:hypothetical protein